MKVSVYKLEGGGMSVMVESSPGKGRAPVLLQDITPENIAAKVLPVIQQLRRPKGAQLELGL